MRPMKVYTVKPHDFLDNIDDDGYIVYNHKVDDDKDYYDLFTKPYQWMNSQYEQLTGMMADRDLIWVFNRRSEVEFIHLLEDKLELSIFTFEVPMSFFKSNFLWSDFQLWHIHLNQIDGWESDFELFDINPKKDSAQGVTSRLKREWIKRVERSDEI